MQFTSQVRADRRALVSAALLGSGVGLALGVAYMAGGMARATVDHSRSSRLAEAAGGGFSDMILEREAGGMDPGVLRVARRHDPSSAFELSLRGRQSADLADRLERGVADARQEAEAASKLVLRASFGGPYAPAAAPFHAAGALNSSRELECLTQAVYFEARGETPAGQAAVAQVVLNRVRHPAFPKSVCGVVYQGAAKRAGCQFSFACDGSMRRGHERQAWNRAQRVAAKALSGAVMANVGSATHFHTTNVAPNWGPQLMRVAQVGLHVFYRFDRSAPTRYVAEAPQRPARQVYAASLVPPAPSQPSPPSDIRLTSAVAAGMEAPKLESPAAAGLATPGVEAAVEPKAAAKLTPTAQPRPVEPPRLPTAAAAS